MIFDAVSVADLVIAAVAVLIGSAAQSVVGFGLNLIAVPVLLFAGADRFVPGPLIVVLLLQAWTLVQGEGRQADWQLLRWFLPVRVVGTAAGLVVAANLRSDALIVLICILVIAAVGLSMSGWRIRSGPTSWSVTGFASGFGNVISSIGGPPLALALTDHPPAAQRTTQGWSAIFGSAMSIAMLWATNKFNMTDVAIGLVLVPTALLGSFAIRPIRSRLPTADALRPWVWGIAIGGSVATIARTLLRL